MNRIFRGLQTVANVIFEKIKIRLRTVAQWIIRKKNILFIRYLMYMYMYSFICQGISTRR